MSKKLIKNIVIIVAVVVILFIVYAVFFKKDSSGPQSDLTSARGNVPAQPAASDAAVTSQVGEELLSLLLNLNSLSLDASVLENPAFDRLTDISITLPPEGARGRANPFAPIGLDLVFFDERDEEEIEETGEGDATDDGTVAGARSF